MLPREAGAGPRRAKPQRPAAAAAPPERDSPRLRKWAPWIAAALALAAYANTLSHDFVWDDRYTVVLNENLHDPARLPALLTQHVFAGAADAMEGVAITHYYRPVWMLSLALDHAVWGLEPFGYHLTNLLLHAAAAALVTLLLLGWIESPAAALAAGALFALHPAHTEAVAWVSGRNELLLAVFVSVAWLAWRRRARGTAWGALAIAAFVLALLSKETAVVFPALLLLEEWRSGGGALARRLRGPLWFLVLAVAFLVLRLVLVPLPAEPVPLVTRVLTAPGIVLEYVRLLFAPIGLRVFHAVPPRVALSDPGVWVPVLVLAVLVLGVLRVARSQRALAFGLGWILVTLLPVSGVLAWLKPTPLAERYLYLPSIGWAVAIGVLFSRLATWAERTPRVELRATRRRALEAAAVAVAALFFVGTWSQNGAWRDKLSILTRIVRDSQGHWPAGNEALGLTYRDLGRWEDAVRELATAARLKPEEASYHLQLGHALLQLNRFAEAERSLVRAAELAPRDAEPRFELGTLYERAGRVDEAAREYRAAVALDPGDVEAHGALGLLAFNARRYAEAESSYRAALRLLPDDPRSWQNLGGLYLAQGRVEEAIGALEHAIRVEPRLPESHFNLALALLDRRRFEEAERSVRTGIGLAPSPRATLLLARVLVASGKRNQAAALLEPLRREHPDAESQGAIDAVLAAPAPAK